MILQLDVGNTRLKWRLLDGSEFVERGALVRGGMDLPRLAHEPKQVWVASVAGEELEIVLRQRITDAWGVEPWFARSSAASCGVHNSYDHPARMGVDRWLAMLAAWNATPGPVCVVDAGSALTIDFVADSGAHLGGYILPGMDSMERALLSDTDRVRFTDAARDCLQPGRSTEAAVFNGLLLSQAGAVALALNRMANAGEIYYSGGNGAALQAAVDRGGMFAPELVLDGLALQAQAEGNS